MKGEKDIAFVRGENAFVNHWGMQQAYQFIGYIYLLFIVVSVVVV